MIDKKALKKEMEELLKASRNKNATLLGKDGIVGEENMSFIDTGSYIINALLSASIYKGIPTNMITVLSGNEAVGKTFMAINIVKNFQNKYEGGMVHYFETEHALLTKMIVERGVDPDRWIHHPVNTVEEFNHESTKQLNLCADMKLVKPMIVLDSLGNLSTTKEMKDIEEGNDIQDMTRAKKVKAMFRVLALKLGNMGVPMLVTNHIYKSQGMFPKNNQGGGSGVLYGGDTILEISKAKERDSDKNIIGNVLTFKNTKSRLTRENCVVKTRLFYDTGLDKYYGLLDLGKAGDLFKKVGNKWEFPNGDKAFESVIYKNGEKWFTPEILDKLDAIAEDVFNYGTSKELLVVEDVE